MSETNRRRRADRSVPPVVVTTDDGRRWRCSMSVLGRESEPRWILIDGGGEQYVGPAVLADRSPEAVQRLVADWWAAKRAQDQSGS